MSFEINNDSRSERFRDQISKALVQALGPELQYGRWTVTLRSERDALRVTMTGPGVSEEWAFSRGETRSAEELALRLQGRLQEARRPQVTNGRG